MAAGLFPERNMISLMVASVLVVGTLGQPVVAPVLEVGKPLAPLTAGPYQVLKTFDLGGEGGWDCLTVDAEAHRLYVPRGTHVMIVDTETGKQVGDIIATLGVHCVALGLGKGYASNGRTNDVTVFDLQKMKSENTVKAGTSPDMIIFEPVTKRVFCFNGKSNDATVINAADGTVAGTIAVGGKPELAVVDGGKVYVNVEDTSELLRIDAASMKVEQRTSLAPGAEPTGLALDAAHHLLFAACANEKMMVVEEASMKVVGSAPIGKNTDGAGFANGLAFSSNGEGTLTVVKAEMKEGAAVCTVVQTLATAAGARTMAVDEKAHRIYLVTAEAEEVKPGEKPARRPKMKPGTFKVIVVGPAEAAK